MSLTFIEHNRLLSMEERQRKELDAVNEIIRKQDEQIKILKRIVYLLEVISDVDN